MTRGRVKWFSNGILWSLFKKLSVLAEWCWTNVAFMKCSWQTWFNLHNDISVDLQRQILIFSSSILESFLHYDIKCRHYLPRTDTSASSTSPTPSRHDPTITEQISTTMPSHLDYFQNDGEYLASMPKQYHSGEVDIENDVGDEDVLHRNPLDRGPFFEVTATKNITAIAGHSAYLNCRVRNLGNRTVSCSSVLIS